LVLTAPRSLYSEAMVALHWEVGSPMEPFTLCEFYLEVGRGRKMRKKSSGSLKPLTH
jgi:hypothetical protein